MTHTKLPWSFRWETDKRDWAIVLDKNFGIVANVNTETGPDVTSAPATRKMPAEDNARFIVTACNSHDDLLAACKKAVELLALLRLDANIGDFLHDDERRFYHDTDDQLRAAIAKAEGGA